MAPKPALVPSEEDALSLLLEAELSRLCADKLFSKSKLLQRLLRLLADRALAQLPVTESYLAQQLLGLEEQDFHPYTNPYVRVNTSLLRQRLRQYYSRETPLHIILDLPSGGFALRIERVSAQNLQWKRLFSQAKLLSESRYVEELLDSVSLLEQVLDQNPAFTPAWACLTKVHLSLAGHGAPPQKHIALARTTSQRAWELAPDSWESLAAVGAVAGLVDLDWDLADECFLRAQSIPGNHLIAYPWFQAHLVATGQLQTLLPLMERALTEYELPPRALQQNYGICLHLAGRTREAMDELHRTAMLFPDDYSAWIWIAIQHWLDNSPAKALEALSRGLLASRDRMPGQIISHSMAALRNKISRSAPSMAGSTAELTALFAALVVGQHQHAWAAFARMIDARNPIFWILLRSQLIRRLSDLPEYRQTFEILRVPGPEPYP